LKKEKMENKQGNDTKDGNKGNLKKIEIPFPAIPFPKQIP
jgi:hypothetical protein